MHLALGDVPFVPAVWELLASRGWRASTYSRCSKKTAPFLVEDGAIRLLDLCSQAYAKRATSSWSTSVILTSELTGTNSLTPW